MHGTKCAKHTPASGGYTFYSYNSLFSSYGVAALVYLYFTAAVTSDTMILNMSNGTGGRVCSASIDAASHVSMAQQGSGVSVWSGSSAHPLNQWFRVEQYGAVNAASSTTGTLKTAYYLGDSSTAVATSTGTVSPGTSTMGTVQITQVSAGKYNTSAYATAFYTDDFTVNDAASDFIGVAGAPVVTAGATQTVAASASFSLPWTATDPNGDPLTYSATADAGNPASLGTLTVGGTAPNKTVTGTAPATPGKYLVNVTANDGTTTTSGVLTLYVTSTSVSVSGVVGSTNWTASTGTIAGCLSDASQSTYAQSPSNPTAEVVTVKLQPYPLGATSGTIAYEFSQDVSSPARSLTVTLYQTAGGTSIAAKTEATITTSIVAGSLVLTSGQLASWTDRNESVITLQAD